MGNGIIVPTEIDTSGFEQGSSELKSAINGLVNAFSKAFQEIQTLVANGVGEGSQASVQALENLKNIVRQILSITGYGANASADAIYQLDNALEQLPSAQVDAFSATVNQVLAEMQQAGTSANTFSRSLDQVGKSSSKAGSKLKGVLLKALKNLPLAPFKTMGFVGNLLGIGKDNGLKGMFNKLLKPLTSMGGMLKNITARGLLSGLIMGAREGMENLMRYSKETRESILSLRASLGMLKNSLATAFAPILTVIAPIIKSFVNMLAKAISYVSQFISALTGKSTYIRAKEYVDGYTSSTKGATKATKDLERQLAGFDDLEILKDANSGGSGGSGGGGASAGDMFETVPIDNGIADFVAKIKEQFAEGNFYEVGESIANGLNSAISWAKDNLNWDVLGDKITEKIDMFAGIFNGLVENIDWQGIGTILGNSVNILLNSIEQIMKKFNWSALGSGIANALNGLLDSGAISKAFSTLDSIIKAGLDTINGFLRDFDFKKAGNELMQSIKNFFVDFDYAGLGEAISNLVIGAIDFAIGLVEDGDAIADMIEGLLAGIGETIANIDISSILNGIAKLIGRLIYTALPAIIKGALKGFLEMIFNIGRGIYKDNPVMQKFIDSMEEKTIGGIDKAFEGIDKATTTALGEWDSTVDKWFPKATKDQKTNVTGMGAQIATSIKNDKTISKATSAMAKTAVDEGKKSANDAKNIGKNVVSGIGKGLEDTTARNTLWSKARSLGNTLISKIKSTLQIASPSKVMADEVGYFIPLGVAEGIGDSEPKMLKTVSDMAGAITKQLANESYDVGFVAGDGLENGLSTFADKVVDTFEQLAKRLEAITDRITFRSPAIASGVIPYSLQDGAVRSNSMQTDELQRQVVNAIAGASTVIVRAINANSPNITIDSQSLTDSVVAEINRRTRQLNASPLL